MPCMNPHTTHMLFVNRITSYSAHVTHLTHLTHRIGTTYQSIPGPKMNYSARALRITENKGSRQKPRIQAFYGFVHV